MKQATVALTILALGVLACGQTGPRKLSLYPSPTLEAISTPVVIQITATPNATQTPNYIVVSATPNAARLCANAAVAVYLRPSPNDQNYPLTEVPNGTELIDLGGRSDKWIFVELGDKEGWVHRDYLGECR